MKTFTGIVMLLACAAGLAAVGWFCVKPSVQRKPQYCLAAENISITPPPNWVPETFVKEVLAAAGLNQPGLLLDKTLPQKLADAFAAYPWIENVEAVDIRYPSGADVKLSYRTPAAFVTVPNQGRYPVDRSGILLPSDYFVKLAPEKQSQYLTIAGIRTAPLGAAGTPWGDPLVQTAAQLAGVLGTDAAKLKLTQITPLAEETPAGIQIVCTLQTLGKTEIIWGAFVSDESQNEAKKRQLWNLNDQYRSLDNIPAKLKPVRLTVK
ncbi:MAG: hypothetical protein LBT89_05365 [Planctomycetaceae bacterium]|jgi:hypothetical protein|nr:hypothetical protein [Planctomycetaceae bacterium]